MDFGTAGIGDPAGDFACIIYNYGESFLKRMARFYPEIEEALDRARFWAGTLELEWILGGAQAKRLPYFLTHIGSAKDAKPMGCPFYVWYGVATNGDEGAESLATNEWRATNEE